MNELIPFDFNDHRVRTVMIDGDPWFIVADACAALTLRDVTSAVRMVDDEDRQRLRRSDTPLLFEGVAPQVQEINLVNESGLYAMIFHSNKPVAKKFKRWVTHEVLPSVRQTGGYGQQQPRELSRLELIDMARESEVGRLEAEQKLAIAAPKAAYVDSFVNGDSDATVIRVLANQLQIGEKVLRTKLTANKAIYQKLEGRRWSEKENRLIPEYSWHAYATHKSWFVERDQPDAPRYHNGQMRTTLYVTPIGKVEIRKLLERIRAQEEQEGLS